MLNRLLGFPLHVVIAEHHAVESRRYRDALCANDGDVNEMRPPRARGGANEILRCDVVTLLRSRAVDDGRDAVDGSIDAGIGEKVTRYECDVVRMLPGLPCKDTNIVLRVAEATHDMAAERPCAAGNEDRTHLIPPRDCLSRLLLPEPEAQTIRSDDVKDAPSSGVALFNREIGDLLVDAVYPEFLQ